jgi:quinol monooxygenase YgiN
MNRAAILATILGLAGIASVRFVSAGEKANPILEAAKANVSDPKKPFTMVVFATIKEGKGAEFEDAFKPAIVATRKEKGCIAYDLNRDQKDSAKYYVYERWQSIAALEHHMQTEHIKTLLQKIGDMLAGPPETKFFIVAGE